MPTFCLRHLDRAEELGKTLACLPAPTAWPAARIRQQHFIVSVHFLSSSVVFIPVGSPANNRLAFALPMAPRSSSVSAACSR